jgi:sulfite reductase (NADPH) hemoprotein beta-component
VQAYLDLRHEDERFVDTVHRVGAAPFKARVYGEQREVARAA